jgi:CheY-like chemotaxis protein
LPVIALTARSRKEDRERCLAAGMDDFLAKPIQPTNLWTAIERLVGARPSTELPARNLLDAGALLVASEGDAGILESICQMFLNRLPHQLTAIQDALAEGDTVRLREAAHKLCGMVAVFSTVARDVASNLEDHAANGRLEESRPLVERLGSMTQELRRLAGELSIDTLRGMAGPVGDTP